MAHVFSSDKNPTVHINVCVFMDVITSISAKTDNMAITRLRELTLKCGNALPTCSASQTSLNRLDGLRAEPSEDESQNSYNKELIFFYARAGSLYYSSPTKLESALCNPTGSSLLASAKPRPLRHGARWWFITIQSTVSFPLPNGAGRQTTTPVSAHGDLVGWLFTRGIPFHKPLMLTSFPEAVWTSILVCVAIKDRQICFHAIQHSTVSFCALVWPAALVLSCCCFLTFPLHHNTHSWPGGGQLKQNKLPCCKGSILWQWCHNKNPAFQYDYSTASGWNSQTITN